MMTSSGNDDKRCTADSGTASDESQDKGSVVVTAPQVSLQQLPTTQIKFSQL